MTATAPASSFETSALTSQPAGSVVTFYSYKGGVGRSMAVANTAWLLASKYGKRVIVIDWDLEAPGLHRFFGIEDSELGPGVIDYLTSYRDALSQPDRSFAENDVLISPYLRRVDTFLGGGSLQFMSAGSQRDRASYVQKVRDFDWKGFYDNWGGAQLIEAMRTQLRQKADITLIDSRTGITDIGGICTVQLPDTVVFVFVFNFQNMNGVATVASELHDRENKTLQALQRWPELHFLPSRKELSEQRNLRDWEARAEKMFARFCDSPQIEAKYGNRVIDYLRDLSVPYVPYFAYGEELAAKTDLGLEICKTLELLIDLLLQEKAQDAAAIAAKHAQNTRVSLPKNIAVFADGTNNAALFRTNVWRLYAALDTQVSADGALQVAYYHDGVGTSSFRPLAILGGAFGWGLKRNVLDCYKFICRNYRPGDSVYLFGFSRGAFTVRVLAGLICQEGLVKPDSNRNLEVYARDAYRAYRRRFNWTGGLVAPLRSARDRYLAWMRRRSNHSTYTPEKNVKPQQHGNGFAVEFIGAWDTVAAYGTPVAELTRGIDEWIWPLSMPDYTLHEGVRIARHAVSLDDERDTFHPLLWDEIRSKNPERIRQVWFAGVHSDVGGGYPDGSASYKPLEWMMDQAITAGLIFAPHEVVGIRRTAMSTGPLHDSRRGLAGYYRYQPRKISAHIDPPDPTTRLMQDPKQPASQLRTVNIHESVLQRIANANDGYAPIVLTGNYAIVADDGTVRHISEPQRETDQERVWDWVLHKRVCYFASLLVSLCLALFPVWHWVSHPAPCTGPACLLAPVISSAGAVLPGFAEPWIAAFAATPGWTVVFVVILVWLLRRSGGLQDRIHSEMRALWERTLELGAVTAPPAVWSPLRINGLRTSRRYQNFFQRLKWQWLPPAFGAPLLILLIVGGLTVAAFAAARGGIWVAEATEACPVADVYKTSSKCYPLGRSVEAGQLYRVTVQVTAPWSDRRMSTTPEGFGPTRMSFVGNLMAPLRRSPSARWFQPLIKVVGSRLGPINFYRIVPLEMELIDPTKGIYAGEFVAPIAGNVQFFVNDVELPEWLGPLVKDYYPDNHGAAAITLEPCTADECVSSTP